MSSTTSVYLDSDVISNSGQCCLHEEPPQDEDARAVEMRQGTFEFWLQRKALGFLLSRPDSNGIGKP